jgi:hypothetical protein
LTMAFYHRRTTFHIATLNDEHTVTLSFSPSLVLPWLALHLLLHYSLFIWEIEWDDNGCRIFGTRTGRTLG